MRGMGETGRSAFVLMRRRLVVHVIDF
jgi:hypothetical protein